MSDNWNIYIDNLSETIDFNQVWERELRDIILSTVKNQSRCSKSGALTEDGWNISETV